MALSTPGIGSGLDVAGIVSKLMSVESQPLTDLNAKEASYQAKLTAYGSIKGALSSFQGSIKSLADYNSFKSVSSTSSDTSSVTVTSSNTAVAGNYAVNVSKLARAHVVATAGRANTSDVIGTGTLTFYFGTYTAGAPGTFDLNSNKSAKTVNIDAAHSSLTGIRDAINAADIGVSASIVNDGSTNGYKLVVTSNDTGKSNSLKVDVTGDSGLVSTMKYDPAGVRNMSEVQVAQNAEFSVNGLSISKASNTVTDAVDGVTLNLLKETTSAVTVKVAKDSSTVKTAISGFVKAYNDLNKTLKDLSAFNTATKKGAILLGDSGLRTIQSQIRTALSSALTVGNLKTLSQGGISFGKDGTLSVNAAKLDTALANPSDVTALFAAFGVPSDSFVKFQGSSASTAAGTYDLKVTTMAKVGKSVGGALASLTINSGNKDLSLTVDGVSASVTLAEAVYTTTDELAAEVQSKINGASALSSANVSVAVNQQGKTIGSQAADLNIIFGSNDTIDVNVDGVTATVTLDPLGYADAAALAAHVQSKINAAPALVAAGKTVTVSESAGMLSIASDLVGSGSKVVVTGGNGADSLLGAARASGGVLNISSNRYGSASSVVLAAGVAKTNLLGASPTDSVGLDIAGTIGGESATGAGQVLTGTGTDVKDLKLQITSGAAGDRGSVMFSKGFAYQLNVMLDSMLSETGAVASRTDGINASIKDIGRQRETLQRRLADVEQRYRNQFTSLDKVVSNLNATSSFMTQQLDRLSKMNG